MIVRMEETKQKARFKYDHLVTEDPQRVITSRAQLGWRVHTFKYVGDSIGSGGYMRRKYSILFECRVEEE
jgi:hypothetical protein